MKNTLAIITVNYNNYPVTQELLACFKNQTETDFHIYLSDLSPKKQPIETNKCTVLPMANRGYAAGINTGLKRAMADNLEKFCVINNDIYFENDFVSSVKASLETNPRSLIGGKIYYAPGFEYHKNRYGQQDLGRVIWFAGGQVDWNHALTLHRGVDQVDQEQFNRKETTDFITGCLMAFDKSTVETVGFWDESYFLYYEDADYCERSKRKNIKLTYDPSLVIWHKNAQSTGGAGSSLHQKYQNKNHLKFGLKYAPLRTKLHLLKNSLFRQ